MKVMELLITWMQHHHNNLRKEDGDISYEHEAQLESNNTGL